MDEVRDAGTKSGNAPMLRARKVEEQPGKEETEEWVVRQKPKPGEDGVILEIKKTSQGEVFLVTVCFGVILIPYFFASSCRFLKLKIIFNLASYCFS